MVINQAIKRNIKQQSHLHFVFYSNDSRKRNTKHRSSTIHIERENRRTDRKFYRLPRLDPSPPDRWRRSSRRSIYGGVAGTSRSRRRRGPVHKRSSMTAVVATPGWFRGGSRSRIETASGTTTSSPNEANPTPEKMTNSEDQESVSERRKKTSSYRLFLSVI